MTASAGTTIAAVAVRVRNRRSVAGPRPPVAFAAGGSAASKNGLSRRAGQD